MVRGALGKRGLTPYRPGVFNLNLDPALADPAFAPPTSFPIGRPDSCVKAPSLRAVLAEAIPAGWQLPFPADLLIGAVDGRERAPWCSFHTREGGNCLGANCGFPSPFSETEAASSSA